MQDVFWNGFAAELDLTDESIRPAEAKAETP